MTGKGGKEGGYGSNSAAGMRVFNYRDRAEQSWRGMSAVFNFCISSSYSSNHPKTQDCQSISNVQKQDRMSNSPCCVLKHRHIFLWKHNDDIIALEFSKIF